MNKIPKTYSSAIVCVMLLGMPLASQAYAVEKVIDSAPAEYPFEARLEATQNGGMSLSQAVDSVRRRGNVERIISAETRVRGGREVHYVKVLTRDGKVRTHKIPGRQKN